LFFFGFNRFKRHVCQEQVFAGRKPTLQPTAKQQYNGHGATANQQSRYGIILGLLHNVFTALTAKAKPCLIWNYRPKQANKQQNKVSNMYGRESQTGPMLSWH